MVHFRNHTCTEIPSDFLVWALEYMSGNPAANTLVYREYLPCGKQLDIRLESKGDLLKFLKLFWLDFNFY